VAIVDGYPCVTLGHGLHEPGVEHAFYGTQKVIDALLGMIGWAEGAVGIESIVRDEAGHAIGFVQAQVPPHIRAQFEEFASFGGVMR
jgi:hypothetical protein